MKDSLLKRASFVRLACILLALSFVISSCNDEDDDDDMTPAPTLSVVEIAQQDDRFDSLVAALDAAGLTSALNTTTPYTVFAPTDEAFETLLNSSDDFERLSDISQASLAALLQYHVVNGTVLSSQLSDGQTVPTLLSGESLTIGVNGSAVTVNGANVVEADVEATNGVIHVIDEILIPEGFTLEPAAPDQTIAEIATATADLSILVDALERAPDLLAAASDETADLTVFAPTNAAFASLLTTLSEATGNTYDGLEDIPDYVLERVLTYHILAASKTAAELEASETTLEGSALAINASSGVIINENVNVVGDMADIAASNGVVHVIDAVLVPPFIADALGTVLAPALFDMESRFTTLIMAVETAGLAGALTNPEATLTVFAPTNDAFNAYIESAGLSGAEALLAAENLGEILQYHVLGTTVASTDIAAGSSMVPTLLEGSSIYISNNGDEGIYLNGEAQVIAPDLSTDNGVVHAIDAMLVPPTQTVADMAISASQNAESPQFTLLVAALQNADDTGGDLVELLQSTEETFTVFAPTDQAFQAAGFADVAAIEAADPALLRSILLYHVIAGSTVFSTDLSAGEVATANGNITINLGDQVTITDANADSPDATVTAVNMLGTNGVIHVIDQVLIPE